MAEAITKTYRGANAAEVREAYEADRWGLAGRHIFAMWDDSDTAPLTEMTVTYLPLDAIYFRVDRKAFRDRSRGRVNYDISLTPEEHQSGWAGTAQQLRSLTNCMGWSGLHWVGSLVGRTLMGIVLFAIGFSFGEAFWGIAGALALGATMFAVPFLGLLTEMRRGLDLVQQSQQQGRAELLKQADKAQPRKGKPMSRGGQPKQAPRPKPLGERDPIPARLRFTVLQRDNYRCQYCGRTQQDGHEMHVDHIVPVSKGGLTSENNLITSCRDCNLGKGTQQVI